MSEARRPEHSGAPENTTAGAAADGTAGAALGAAVVGRPPGYTIQAAVATLMGIPLLFIVGTLAHDSWHEYTDGYERSFQNMTTIRAITAATTERFLEQSRDVLTQLAKRPDVRALNRGKCDPLLTDLKRIYQAYTNILTLDSKGLLVCSALGVSPGQSAGPDPKYYFAETVRTGKFTVGKPAKGFLSGRWVSTLAHPIFDEHGEVTGVIGLSVDLVNFKSQVAQSDIPESTVIGIINSEGVIIARSSEADRIGGISNAEATGVMLRQKQGNLRARDFKERNRLYSFGPVSGSDWTVFASVDEELALAAAQALAVQRFALLGFLALLVAVIVMTIGRYITRPLTSLSRVFAQVGEGRLDARAPPTGPTEIRQISFQFNALLDSRAAADLALQVSEARFRATFEHAAVGIAHVALDGRFLIVNRQFSAICGYPQEELLKLTFQDITHPQDLEIDQANVQSLIEGRSQTYSIRKRYLRKDGSQVWINLTVSLVRTGNDAADYFISVIEDINEKFLSEDRLQSQLNELRRWHDLTVDRELKMVDLKREINELSIRAGLPPRYQHSVSKKD